MSSFGVLRCLLHNSVRNGLIGAKGLLCLHRGRDLAVQYHDQEQMTNSCARSSHFHPTGLAMHPGLYYF